MSAAAPLPRRVRGPGGFAYFTDLKAMSRSPAHYLESCLHDRPSKRPLDVGTVTHTMVLGGQVDQLLAVYPGPVRRGKRFDAFVEANPGATILIQSEWDAARGIADAVLAHPRARELIDASSHEVPLRWTDCGVDCATRGIDLLGPGFVGELKSTTDTEPNKFGRLAFRMFYHAQLAHYGCGARLNGHEIDRYFVIGVEVTRPYAVTVLEMTPALHDLGRKTIATWLERLKVCEENAHWPEYVQHQATWDIPHWMHDGDDDA